jgi:MYXO-CTERM domain-containing protein
VTLIGLALLALACIGFASAHLKDDSPDRASEGTWDALLFLLVLVGVLHARRKRDSEDE